MNPLGGSLRSNVQKPSVRSTVGRIRQWERVRQKLRDFARQFGLLDQLEDIAAGRRFDISCSDENLFCLRSNSQETPDDIATSLYFASFVS